MGVSKWVHPAPDKTKDLPKGVWQADAFLLPFFEAYNEVVSRESKLYIISLAQYYHITITKAEYN